MPKNDFYKVFSTRHLPKMGKVYCIITSYENELNNIIYSELYLFQPKIQKYYGLVLESEKKEILDLKIDSNFIFNKAKEMVINRLDNQLFELLEDNDLNLYNSTTVSLNEVNIFELFSIIKGPDFSQFIKTISLTSGSDKLKQAIHYIWNIENNLINTKEVKLF